MNRPLPFLALALGIAGLIPFAAFGVFAMQHDADRWAFGLAAYAAVILAFLGGVHWGFALPEPSGRGEAQRLGLGVVPSLIGWVGLLLAIAVGITPALAVLLAGFVALTLVERRAAATGLMPHGYMRLRYGLSAVVVTILLIVVILRVIGAQIHLPAGWIWKSFDILCFLGRSSPL